MSDTLLQTRGLTKIYLMGGEEIRAVDNVDLEVERGEFIGIMGPSGSGKTTLLNLVSGIDRLSGGSIRFQGQELAKLSERQLDDLRLRHIGFVFQRFNLLPVLSALENVMLPMQLAGLSAEEQRRRATELLSWVGLSRRLGHKPRELSAGENQRVGIARALANNPSLLLADEATGNLDSRTSRDITHLFQRVNTEYGITIVLVTHNPQVAQAARRQLRMADGKLKEVKG